jgi:septum formation protein
VAEYGILSPRSRTGLTIPTMKKLILASASPRRSDLLHLLGMSFDVVPSHVSETLDRSIPPADYVRVISSRKARAVAASFRRALVLGADTVVVLEGDILEKPAGEYEAIQMLSRLSGKTHRVYTGLTLIDTESGRSLRDVAVTDVAMRPLKPEEIQLYVKTGEPMDKAGAYAVQGRAAAFVHSISGCFYNVVGLPLSLFCSLLERMVGESPLQFASGHWND